MGMLTFEAVKEIGEELDAGKLDEWQLRREEKYENSWVYSLEYEEIELDIDAINGTILRKKD